jgi:hypothetical protein
LSLVVVVVDDALEEDREPSSNAALSRVTKEPCKPFGP